jgi:Fe-S cluster biosynthesis and repair protein YggX
MTTVFCTRRKQDLPTLLQAPMPGALGQIILQHVSADAWHEWLEVQIKIINEERLDLSEEIAQQRLCQQMVLFLGIEDIVDVDA